MQGAGSQGYNIIGHSHYLIIIIFSLTALKVLLGIALMGKASEYQYVHQVARSEANQREQKVKRSISETEHNRSRSSSTAADLHVDRTASQPNFSETQQTITKELGRTKPRATKSLSDIERFTLCSNRIV